MTGDRIFNNQAKSEGKTQTYELDHGDRCRYFGKAFHTYTRVTGQPYARKRGQGPIMAKSATLIDQTPGCCWPNSTEEALNRWIPTSYEEISIKHPRHARLLNHPEHDVHLEGREVSSMNAEYYWSVPPTETCQTEQKELPEKLEGIHALIARSDTGTRVWTKDGCPVSAGPNNPLPTSIALSTSEDHSIRIIVPHPSELMDSLVELYKPKAKCFPNVQPTPLEAGLSQISAFRCQVCQVASSQKLPCCQKCNRAMCHRCMQAER